MNTTFGNSKITFCIFQKEIVPDIQTINCTPDNEKTPFLAYFQKAIKLMRRS